MQLLRLAIAALLLWAVPAAAQDRPPPFVPDDIAFVEFASALTSDLVITQSFELGLKVGFAALLRADPEFATMEEECPGVIDAVTEAARPIMWVSHKRDYLAHRDALALLFQRKLTAQEAREGADFYTSDLGQRLIVATLQNTVIRQSLDAVLADDEAKIDEQAFEQDKRSTVNAAKQAITDSDRAEVERILSSGNLGRALLRVHKDISVLQRTLMNAELLPEEDIALEAVLEEAIEAQFAVCDAEE